MRFTTNHWPYLQGPLYGPYIDMHPEINNYAQMQIKEVHGCVVGEGHVLVWILVPAFASQIRTVLSSNAEARWWPSEEKAMEYTLLVCLSSTPIVRSLKILPSWSTPHASAQISPECSVEGVVEWMIASKDRQWWCSNCASRSHHELILQSMDCWL